MSTLRACPKNALVVTLSILAGLVVIAMLPALGVAAVVLRVVLLAFAAAVAVFCAVAYLLSPGFRRWWAAKLDTQPAYKGLRLRDGIQLDDGHSWSRPRAEHFTIGADDLAQRALGPVDAVGLPALGSYFERGDALFELRSGGRTLHVHSPLSGIVRRRNEELALEPERINDDPYGGGWALELQPLRPDECARLHRGSRARRWFCAEVDRFLRVVAPSDLPVMADGGALIDDLHRVIDEETWTRVRRQFFERRDVERRP